MPQPKEQRNALIIKLWNKGMYKKGAVFIRRAKDMAKPKTKKLLITTLVLLLILSPSLFALDFLYPAKVERVIDGDTIVVDLYLGLGVLLDDQYIRFYGIDTWETRGEEREKGLEAKKYLAQRLEEGKIEIEIRPEWGQNGKGKYGR